MSRPADWRQVPLAPRLLVEPTSGRRGAGLPALTGTTDWRRRAVDRLGATIVGLSGAALLNQAPPAEWPSTGLTDLGERLERALPTMRLIGAVLPRQTGRARLSLLGRMTGNLVVIKVGSPGRGIEREAEVLERLAADPVPGVATPEPLAHGTIDLPDERVAYLVTFRLGGRQRPAVGARLGTFERDLARRLADLPKPAGTPDHYVPIHGDVAPYNLRRTSRGLALFDWEDTTWGPPGSDVTMYRRRCELLAAGAPIPPPSEMLATL